VTEEDHRAAFGREEPAQWRRALRQFHGDDSGAHLVLGFNPVDSGSLDPVDVRAPDKRVPFFERLEVVR